LIFVLDVHLISLDFQEPSGETGAQ
jgi:hypothetical protein